MGMGPEEQKAFDALKTALITTPILSAPYPSLLNAMLPNTVSGQSLPKAPGKMNASSRIIHAN